MVQPYLHNHQPQPAAMTHLILNRTPCLAYVNDTPPRNMSLLELDLDDPILSNKCAENPSMSDFSRISARGHFTLRSQSFTWSSSPSAMARQERERPPRGRGRGVRARRRVQPQCGPRLRRHQRQCRPRQSHPSRCSARPRWSRREVGWWMPGCLVVETNDPMIHRQNKA